MTKKTNGVTTNKSIEVMNAHKFNYLLKLAEQNECIMTDFINFLSNLSMETCSVRDDLNHYLNEEVTDILKDELEDKYAVYFDLEDEYDLREVLEESENINANCVEILNCIDKECFAFEDWGCKSDLNCGNSSFILDYEYDEENYDLIISVSFISRLQWYIEEEAGIEPLKISINQLLIANHSDVA